MGDFPPCDDIDREICSLHPHTLQPCDGNCGDFYLRLTVRDWRGDILAGGGELESLRGGILLGEEEKARIRAIYSRMREGK